ncbi:DUF4183 domain-containing protein [Oceanobacillus caeni]|uniref:DUF4183 domain-containing protein n=1 Tax=Oceanobacillus caeni TaxID=405946 RepID=UPI00076148AF|nr:DUF4183 domain-containing protein [Oceanobacillus caeni]
MKEKQYLYCKGERDRRFTRDNCMNCCQYHQDQKRSINIDNSPVNNNSFHPIFNPTININISTTEQPTPTIGLKTFQYITLAEENKRIYTDEDALKQYGSSEIPNPDKISYMYLFLNGVLQPEVLYSVTEGSLELLSSDLPLNGTPIILLFVATNI